MSKKLPRVTVTQVVPETHVGTPWFWGGPRMPGRVDGETSSCVVSCSQARPPSVTSSQLPTDSSMMIDGINAWMAGEGGWVVGQLV